MQNLETNSIIEAQVNPAWANKVGLRWCFIYRGRSMIPTFRPGQLLYVRPDVQDISPGDMVVFAGSSNNNYVVHRVVSISSSGLITRGDNNSRFDPQPVESTRLIGRVEMVEDKGNVKPVPGGRLRLWRARVRWGALRVKRWLRIALKAPYNLLRNSRIIRLALNRCFSHKLKVIRLETPEGPLFKTIYKGRTIAHWWPQLNRFVCRKPYDLFISRPDTDIKDDPDESETTLKNNTPFR